ncbi:unnamed protein product [Protopolystoma xenopodis]|uniref:Uncharacterized protein n=1 Tax=Protopolystoma xenopodis TaxID=117903 RepID=A0A3S4ZX77_9PLAT|nr:unnamed protein product [Protopolystoma xenopodis]
MSLESVNEKGLTVFFNSFPLPPCRERPGATDCAALSWFSHQHLGGSSLVEVTPTHPESNADLSGSSIPLSTILTPTTSAIVGNNSLAEHFTFSNSVTDSSDHCPSQASPCLSGGTKPQATEGSAHQATEDRT